MSQLTEHRVGFIGLGIMGKPMAVNLRRAGLPLTVFNRSREKCDSLAKLGAAVADSPQEVARASEVIVTVLSDTAAVEHILFGEKGIVSGLQSNSVVIDMSTISPASTIEFARQLASAGCEMLDAPVTGGENGAIAGRLGIMVGGRKETFENCLPILELMGKQIAYTGPSGNGQKTKLVNQLIGATNLIGAVEGLRLARAAGLDLNITLDAVSSGAASSWMLEHLGPRILQGDFAPGFSMRLQLKDLALLNEWIVKLGGEFPAASLAHALFTRAVEMGLGAQGNQGLINLWHST